MHTVKIEKWQHAHDYLDREANADNERRTLWVVLLTAAMMVAEIAAGTIYNSMALLADGWHMATHAGALGITVFAYRFARRNTANRRFTFGVGKVELLGGYTSAVVLALVAVLMLWESVDRLLNPLAISFDQAMAVAVVGLLVNLASAWLLHGGQGHAHGHGHSHGHSHGPNHSHSAGHLHAHDHAHSHGHVDHNLRGAYLHVLADALTSVLAIVALICGKLFGWVWMDAAMGIVGAVVISRWAWGLMRDTGSHLLDSEVDEHTVERVRGLVEADADNRVADLHLWRLDSKHMAAIVSVVTHTPQPPDYYRRLLAPMPDIVHVTVEVNKCDGAPCV